MDCYSLEFITQKPSGSFSAESHTPVDQILHSDPSCHTLPNFFDISKKTPRVLRLGIALQEACMSCTTERSWLVQESFVRKTSLVIR